MMNKNLLIAFAGALLIAILVAMLMSTLLGGTKKKQPRVAEVKRIEILVAAKPIAIGQYLSSESVKWKPWPEEAVFPGAIIRKGDQKAVEAKEGYRLTVDLAEQKIIRPDGEAIDFEIDAFRKHCLLNGLDDIGLTLQDADAIREYEKARQQREPWVFID